LLGLVFELGGHVQGYHQNRNVWRLSSDFFRGIQTIHFRHLEIEHDYIGGSLLGSFDGFSTVGRLTAHPPGVLLFQESPQAAAHKSAVVYQKDSDGRGLRPGVQERHTKPYNRGQRASIHRIA
ncbi:MAG TPA: hypothetical protein VNV63_04475, partial [Nitrospiria bacterium]|nr:hypothetical protein [Nitrospiria bacterium]